MPKLINDGLLFALALTEPQAGSDAAAIIPVHVKTRQVGNQWTKNMDK